MQLTSKQKIILSLVVKGNAMSEIDLDELISRLPYTTTKQSMQFSVRALIAKGLIEKLDCEKRRGRARRVFRATPLGQHWATLLCPPPAPEPIVDPALEQEIESIMEGIKGW